MSFGSKSLLTKMDTEILNCDYAYVLLTAAHNEEAEIEKTLQSVVQQIARPKRWVIVSDNCSTDNTEEVVKSFKGFPFEYRRNERNMGPQWNGNFSLKQAQDTLAARESQLRAIMDGVPAPVAYIDRDERCQYVNRTFLHYFGLSAEKITS